MLVTMMAIILAQEIWITAMEGMTMKVLGQVICHLKMLSLRSFWVALYNLIILPKRLPMGTGNFFLYDSVSATLFLLLVLSSSLSFFFGNIINKQRIHWFPYEVKHDYWDFMEIWYLLLALFCYDLGLWECGYFYIYLVYIIVSLLLLHIWLSCIITISVLIIYCVSWKGLFTNKISFRA